MLAIECATEVCSLALFEDGDPIASHHELLGRGHAEYLIPLIAALPDRGRAQEIRVSLGPGSFTGVRIGLAAARALGLAWGSLVRGYPTLALVAATAQSKHPGAISVCMAGGHGEWFVQDYGGDLIPEDAVSSLRPEDTLARASYPIIAGNRAAERVALEAGRHTAVEVMPDARFAAAIPQSLLSDDLAPIYGRGPDARLPA